ncbi:acetyltransferase (isoleucine patch superfamily) [Belliella baltica DSM 15883]|uniref:Acetyltransferase (Isoleucine patch superfamily) n=1 Tax=Belliella baltica (strain DSM 15883 / CIP 108006 / LMG 21964 / BA134) TaxID=866536 RepID=I3Z753_BELBD|nr:CatB-related O-acetyltransferase [Belliella baltica]AFL85071.1 acetyltransferase (isoleucine patch superfamily) [Belliella baltica DSM 15883]
MIKKFINLFIKRKKSDKHKIYTNEFSEFKQYEIGSYTYGHPLVLDWNEGTTLKIGKFCSIADDVKIFLGGNHRIDWVSTYPFNILNSDFPSAKKNIGHPATKGDVVIGNDVWIGRGVTILSGCKIGDGAVIAAESVITKSINPYEIHAGNPSKLIRKRFSDDEIEFLLKFQWWNLPITEINNIVFLLQSGNILKLINRYKIS